MISMYFKQTKSILLCCALAFLLQGCGLMPHAGPSKLQVQRVEKSQTLEGVRLVKVDDAVARKLNKNKNPVSLAEAFGKSGKPGYVIGPGDTVEVTIWETAPAILFRQTSLDANPGSMGVGAENLPPQMVMEDGAITVPFAGRVKVTGRSLSQIEQEVANRLAGKANNPQVMVRVVRNNTSQVSVIGDVAKSCNIPLTPRGEKLLDALATAGGVAHPINKVSIQLSRKGINARMPLDKIVRDPKQNLSLMPGDVITAFFQPWTFSVLGATGRNQEVPFESSGISLAQAISRSGGLNDMRADAGGVFIFRFEDAEFVDDKPEFIAEDGKIPVVYQVNFNDPSSFFATQNFPIQDKDVMYVANMPAAELQKFVAMVGMVLTPTLNIGRYNLEVSN